MSTNEHLSVSENGVKQWYQQLTELCMLHQTKHTSTQRSSSSCLTHSEHITPTSPLAWSLKECKQG